MAIHARERLLHLSQTYTKAPIFREPRKDVPGPNTKLGIVYQYVESIGGIKEFQVLLRTKSQTAIARELNVPPHIVANFQRDFFLGRWCTPPWLYNHLRKLAHDRLNRPKQLSLKDARTLW